MTDIRLKSFLSLEVCTMDWLLRDTGGLDEREELATSVRVALGTDRLADANEILPDPDDTDRKGWWGDFEAEEIWSGWPIGTKNWLLARAKITEATSQEGSTLERARRYIQEALQPFVDKHVASQISVFATRIGLDRIDVDVKMYRGPEEEIDLRYQALWQEEAVSLENPKVIKTSSRILSLTLKTASPSLGTPVFVTKSPVHLPNANVTIASPVIGSPIFLTKSPVKLPTQSLTVFSPSIYTPVLTRF